MDVVHVRKLITRGFNKDFEQHRITKIKKFLVYDPSRVTGWDIEKKVKAGLEKL